MIIRTYKYVIILLLILALLVSPSFAMICMNGTMQLTCTGTPPVCPQDQTACSSASYTVTGVASVDSTGILNKNGFTGISTTSNGAINISGWSCTGSNCTKIGAGSLQVSGGDVSGTVSSDQITSVNGNGENLDFYNGSTLLGSITVSGCTFTGSASDTNGLLSVSATGSALVFTGMNCVNNNCSIGAAGTIAVAGMSYSCPLGSQYPCGNTGSGYACSDISCFDETAGGTIPSGSQVCIKDLNGDGTIEQNEIQQCTAVTGGMFCPIDAVNCSVSYLCASGTYNTARQRCEAAVTGYSCPTNYIWSSTLSICQAAPQCLNGGSYNTTTQRCEESATASYSCSLSGTYADLSSCNSGCTQSGTCNSSTGYCIASSGSQTGDICFPAGCFTTNFSSQIACPSTSTCPSGASTTLAFYYDSGTTCIGGTGRQYSGYSYPYYICSLNSSTYYSSSACSSACVNTGTCSGPTYSCASGWTLTGTICYQAATCPGSGSLNTSDNECETAGTPECPSGMSYDSANNVCYAAPSSSSATCPYGTQYTCLPNPSSGVMQCSDVPCSTMASNQSTATQTSANMTSYQNDGAIDPSTGRCLGQIYIFNGKPSECRQSGVQTMFFNCCNTDSGSFWFIENRCSIKEATTVKKVYKKQCHYIGDYCQESWFLIGCVQEANVYCCFGSELGRIIQEQGRPQLIAFNAYGWGTPESPYCRGFTPEEFQNIDFSKIDFSEFISDMVAATNASVQSKMNSGVSNYFNNLNNR